MSRIARIWLVTVALVLCAAVPTPTIAWAQDQPESGEVSAERRAQVLERVRTVRAMKLKEVLEIDDAKLQKVDAALRKYDEEIFDQHRQVKRKMRRLRRAVNRNEGSDKELDTTVREIVEHKKRLEQLRVQQFEAGAKHLDARQRAKLLIFLPEFERKVKKALRKARGGQDGPGDRGRARGRRRGSSQ